MRGDNCLRQFGNEPSDENLFSIAKFGVRRFCESPQGVLSDSKLVWSKIKSGPLKVVAERDGEMVCSYHLGNIVDNQRYARVAKLADALALGASEATHGGSSPLPRTKLKIPDTMSGILSFMGWEDLNRKVRTTCGSSQENLSGSNLFDACKVLGARWRAQVLSRAPNTIWMHNMWYLHMQE